MRRKDEHLRLKLLKLAETHLREEGVSGVQIRRLAEAAGISTGTIYNYFHDKSEILLALTEIQWREIVGGLQNRFCGQTMMERISTMAEELRAAYQDLPGSLMTLLEERRDEGLRKMADVVAEIDAWIWNILKEGDVLRCDIWTDVFTPEYLVGWIRHQIMWYMRTGEGKECFLYTLSLLLGVPSGEKRRIETQGGIE